MVVAKREKVKNNKKSNAKCHRLGQSCPTLTEKPKDEKNFQTDFSKEPIANKFTAPTTMPFSVDRILGFANSTVAPMAIDPNYAYYRNSYNPNDFRYTYPAPYFGLGRLDWLQTNPHFTPVTVKNDNSNEDGQKNCTQKKRRISRCPRIPFSKDQLNLMEDVFQQQQYLSPRDIENLCRKLDLKEHRVKNWFQNRRAREKRARTSSSITVLTNQYETSPDSKKNVNSNETVTPTANPMYLTYTPNSPSKNALQDNRWLVTIPEKIQNIDQHKD
ncbi:Homeobox protein MSX-1 [Trichoplax sp. H2]|uniref:Homeobox domain-containing protein n=2 Tax=Trichoplax adhaerens TaxID=10228 RepID=B3RKR8_TRIAD|nr:hypothetical protein TRIADDRAFT_51739 [Trichoplax adhaerens]EDV29426.1 hypothetical protein TRIADDRAFT_51739 [Trichoplax adhaerens]RDD44682.1 Homeobox protein MSX-1 [Trichoplax sp. H2]|eukprot:XP_002108628.1 hypothetical protein TRIADDRAFT_51739 [Trichoplax adhaerens]